MFCRHSHRPDRPYRFARHMVLGLGITIVVGAVFGGVVMLAWNAIIPDIFSLPALTFWQSVALLVLVRLLTGRFTHHGRHWRRHHHRHGADRKTYQEWWQSEGESAFQAYAAHHRNAADDQQP